MHANSLRLGLGAVGSLVAALGLLAPLPSSAQTASTPSQQSSYAAHCRTLTKQIAHFEGVADMARDRDDDLWEASTEAHIERLTNRRSQLCPEYDRRTLAAANAQFWSDVYQVMKIGAQGALRYLTFGAF